MVCLSRGNGSTRLQGGAPLNNIIFTIKFKNIILNKKIIFIKYYLEYNSSKTTIYLTITRALNWDILNYFSL